MQNLFNKLFPGHKNGGVKISNHGGVVKITGLPGSPGPVYMGTTNACVVINGVTISGSNGGIKVTDKNGNTIFQNTSVGSVPAVLKKTTAGKDWLSLAVPDVERDRIVYDHQGQPLPLKKSDVLARGGEGVVYKLDINPHYLVKVCKDETLTNPRKQAAFCERLNAMLALEECRRAYFLSWPQMPVFDGNKKVIGYVMPKANGRTLRALYAPRQVKRFFPGWDRLQVTKVALNLVNAVQMLARHRVLVNDFNPDNFLIDTQGKVTLIDCDSFQIPSLQGNTFLTGTFTPEFTAPELLFNADLFSKERTPEQVRFSLAVVVYMILMSGLHPYAQCGGSDPAGNLKSGKCPLDKTSGVRLPVGWYKSVSWLPQSLHDYFARMFVIGHKHPTMRPLIGELKTELENFIEIMRQSNNPNQRAICPENARRKKK